MHIILNYTLQLYIVIKLANTSIMKKRIWIFFSSIFEIENNLLKFIKKLILRIPLFCKILLINFNNLYKKRKNNKQHIQCYINNKQSQNKNNKTISYMQ